MLFLDEATIRPLLPRLEEARVAEPACAGVPEPPVRGCFYVRPEIACDEVAEGRRLLSRSRESVKVYYR